MSLTIDMLTQLSTTEQERLKQIIVRAVPPHERGSTEFFSPQPEQNQTRIEKLRQQWIQSVANDEPDKFDSYLQAQGLNQEIFQEWLAEVYIPDFETLPKWANALVELLTHTQQETKSTEQQQSQTIHVLGVENLQTQIIDLFLWSAKHFLEDYLTTSGLEVSQRGITELLSGLAKRFWQLVEPALNFELRLASINAGLFKRLDGQSQLPINASATDWLDRFEQFPVLAYLIGVTYSNWREWITEICSRLVEDWQLLSKELFDGRYLGKLIGFQGDAGDVHGQGRTVAILTFEGMKKIVYKPKDLRCAEAFVDLIACFNQWGLQPQLHLRRILMRGNYTWEEFVEYQPCGNIQEVERFYTRMGMMIRLLQLLEGRDFWLDNLVAHGEHPVFIDLETLLQPRPVTTDLPPAEYLAQQVLAESAVETGTIAMPTPIGMGISAEDFGALAMPRDFLTPYKRTSTLSGKTDNEIPSEKDYFSWSHAEHGPTLEGRPVEPSQYFNFVLDGYKIMQDFLQIHQASLLKSDSLLSAWHDIQMRFIYRDTWTYHKLIRSSVAPVLLVDPYRREFFLQQLVRPILIEEKFNEQSKQQHYQIIQSEINALRRLDVPLFICRPDSDAVYTLEQKEIQGYFDGTAGARLQQRLEHLQIFPLKQEIDLIRSCFATGRYKAKQPTNMEISVAQLNLKSTFGKNFWLEQAIDIGSSILANALTSSAGDVAWLGLVYHPHIDLLSLEVLPPDLLSGTCGLAILFSDLYTLTGEERWRLATQKALSATIKSIHEVSTTRRDSEQLKTLIPFCGVFLGMGSHLFTLGYCAQALAADELDSMVRTCVANLPIDSFCQGAKADVISGVTGLLLSVLSVFKKTNNQQELDIAITLATHLLNLRQSNGKLPELFYPSQSLCRNILPDATAGLAMGLARLITLDHERTHQFQKHLKTLVWTELNTYHENKFMLGNLLAKLDIIRSLGKDVGQILAEIDNYLAIESPATNTLDIVNRLEVAITVFEVTANDKYRLHAIDCAQRLLAIRELQGSWFAGSFAASQHNLSIVWGITAIARAFLRLYNPSKISSICLL